MPTAAPDNRGFWREGARANVLKWRSLIEADAVVDVSTLHLAIGHGLVKTSWALDQPDGVRRLLSTYENPLVGCYQPSQLAGAGYAARLQLDAVEGKPCRELGDTLLATTPRPPRGLDVGRFSDGPGNFAGAPPLHGLDGSTITEPFYLAVAVLTATEAEAFMRGNPPNTWPDAFRMDESGWLSALVPYIQRRTGIPGAPPAEPLPVREDYRQLFEQWARGEVDFTFADDDTPQAAPTAAAGP